jgi:hypothetical protein
MLTSQIYISSIFLLLQVILLAQFNHNHLWLSLILTSGDVVYRASQCVKLNYHCCYPNNNGNHADHEGRNDLDAASVDNTDDQPQVVPDLSNGNHENTDQVVPDLSKGNHENTDQVVPDSQNGNHENTDDQPQVEPDSQNGNADDQPQVVPADDLVPDPQNGNADDQPQVVPADDLVPDPQNGNADDLVPNSQNDNADDQPQVVPNSQNDNADDQPRVAPDSQNGNSDNANENHDINNHFQIHEEFDVANFTVTPTEETRMNIKISIQCYPRITPIPTEDHIQYMTCVMCSKLAKKMEELERMNFNDKSTAILKFPQAQATELHDSPLCFINSSSSD